MERIPMSYSVRQICNLIKKERITFDNPAQRPAGLWSMKKQSSLIVSIFKRFIPEIYAIQLKNDNNDSVYDIIDGKQRLTTISSYMADEWKLIDLDPIKVSSTGETFNISGLKYSELPESVQDEIKEHSFRFNMIVLEKEDGEQEDIVSDLFYYLNDGVTTSNEHLALVKAKKNVRHFVRKIVKNHKLFTDIAYFTPASIKKSGREITVMQAILLVSGLDYRSFEAKDIETFFATNVIAEETLILTENIFTDITRIFTERKKYISKMNIPVISHILASRQGESKKIASCLIERYFKKDMRTGDKYKSFCGAGNVKKNFVKGRISTLQEICNTQLPQVAK